MAPTSGATMLIGDGYPKKTSPNACGH